MQRVCIVVPGEASSDDERRPCEVQRRASYDSAGDGGFCGGCFVLFFWCPYVMASIQTGLGLLGGKGFGKILKPGRERQSSLHFKNTLNSKKKKQSSFSSFR